MSKIYNKPQADDAKEVKNAGLYKEDLQEQLLDGISDVENNNGFFRGGYV